MKINRTLRYGGYATLVIAAVIGIVAGLNRLADLIPWRADMTFEHFFSLSDQTRQILGGLKAPITMLTLWEPGKEDQKVLELVRRYQGESSLLTLRAVDPYRSPVELQKYEVNGAPPEVGSLILDTGSRFKVLRTADMYVMQQDPNTGEQVPTTFVAESAITNAIVSVTAAKDPVIYFLRGHGEKDLQTLLADKLAKAFYIVRDLPLATVGSVPDDADTVVAVSPQRDITPEEETALSSYMRDRGGKVFLMTDIGADPQPVLGRLLESFGVAIRPYLVVEQAPDHFLPNQPFVLIPDVGQHAITAAIAKADMPILFPASQVVEPLAAVRRTVTIVPLLASSSRSWARVDLNDQSPQKGARDLGGPFMLAAAISDSGEVGEKPSRMVVMGSSHFIFPPASMGRLEENENLFMNALGWLQDRPDLITIGSRTMPANRNDLNLSQLQFFLFAGIAVLLLPLLVFGAGLATWLRRRHL